MELNPELTDPLFSLKTYSYSEGNFHKWVLDYDYHCVYILENGKKAYIGETLDARRRADEHKRKYKEIGFTRMHILTSQWMEETPAKHFEKLLIKLMKVDGKFHIVNGNNGIPTHYYRQNSFELFFDKVWDVLSEKELVKKKEFKLIINSNTYKYSPYTVLTDEQTNVLTHIVNVLSSKETDPYNENYLRRPVWIKGDAGTGKTLLATSLFHYLRNNDDFKTKKIAFVVAAVKMRETLKKVFAETKEGLRSKDVIAPIDLTKGDEKYDIIICDEVHALRRNENLVYYKKKFVEASARLELDDTSDELDWILLQSEYQVLFYDEKQCVKHSDIRHSYVEERILKNKYRGYRPVALSKQMRIKGGDAYVNYIFDVLYQRATQREIFPSYDFKLFHSFIEMSKAIAEKEDTYRLTRLCSGYAWKWVSKKNAQLFDIEIEGAKIKWNDFKMKEWTQNPLSKEQMGSVYTTRGLDLNYVGLVIGPELYYDKAEACIKVNKKLLYSNDIKKGATDEEIKNYVLNSYAILFTRAMEGTYVYVCDSDLRDYFKRFILESN